MCAGLTFCSSHPSTVTFSLHQRFALYFLQLVPNPHFRRPTTRTTKTISSASDSSRSSILTTDRSLREGGEVYTYVNFQPEILNCELVRLYSVKTCPNFQSEILDKLVN